MSAIPRDGLILELLCNGSAEDTSGHGHHAVVHGAVPTVNRFGNPGGALLFDGLDDYLVVSPPPPLGSDALSVSLWARLDTIDVDGWSSCLICQDNGDDNDQARRVFQLSLSCGRLVWHRMMNVRDPTAKQRVAPGAWFHAAAVIDRGEHRLYMDGVLVDSVSHTHKVHAEEPVYIGRKGTPEPWFFVHGALDDVRVFNRAIGASEIDALAGEGGYRKSARSRPRDPISGLWEIAPGRGLDLAYDGERVTGTLPAGRPGNLVAIRNGTFDPATGALRLAGDARRPDYGGVVSYEITGKLRGNRLHLTYRFGDDRGDATVTRRTRLRALVQHAGAAGQWMLRRLEPLLKPVVVPISRTIRGLRRPSKAENIRKLAERGEQLSTLVFRDAQPNDIPALAALHVKTWSATYPGVRHPPTFAIRERQWREAFAKADGSWFCIVIQNTTGDLVGFAKGVVHASGSGDLNKIYLLGEYQRMGLGRLLVGHVVRRFLARGLTRMTLSADEANPSCAFYYALGAENPRGDDGRVERGAFVWNDLQKLASICPVEPNA